MKKILFMILGSVCLSLSLSAQNEVDALRYSLQDLSGSARFVGMGGAFGALGGDMSAISVNPGSLGLYRRSEFGFSMAITSANTSSSYENNNTTDSQVSFGFNNIGFIGSYPGAKEGWERFNFAVAYNKLANFNETVRISGPVENTSLLDVFVDQVQGINSDEISDAFPFAAGLAWETYLINPTDTLGSNLYFHEIPFGKLTQSKTIDRQGAMGETVVAGGANFGNQIYFGASLGFPSINYTENSTYQEGDLDDALELLNFSYKEDLRVNGSGFNMKAGIIIKPADWIRAGVAIHSPTWLSINEVYESSMTSNFQGGDSYNFESPLGEFRYRLKTPARYLVNTGFILGKLGVVSADYEYVDYSQARFGRYNNLTSDYDFSAENEVIGEIYRSTHNVKVGVEWRALKSMRLRAGVGYQQNPFVADAIRSQNDIMTYSAGVGFRKEGFYIDAAYSIKQDIEDYYLYDPSRVNVSLIDGNRGQAIISIGFRY